MAIFVFGTVCTVLTDSILRQPRQRLDRIPLVRLVRHVILAVGVDVGRAAVQLQRRLDQPRQPQDEENETAEDDDAGDQEPLRNQDEDQDDEGDAEGADGDHEREEPAAS